RATRTSSSQPAALQPFIWNMESPQDTSAAYIPGCVLPLPPKISTKKRSADFRRDLATCAGENNSAGTCGRLRVLTRITSSHVIPSRRQSRTRDEACHERRVRGIYSFTKRRPQRKIIRPGLLSLGDVLYGTEYIFLALSFVPTKTILASPT